MTTILLWTVLTLLVICLYFIHFLVKANDELCDDINSLENVMANVMAAANKDQTLNQFYLNVQEALGNDTTPSRRPGKQLVDLSDRDALWSYGR